MSLGIILRGQVRPSVHELPQGNIPYSPVGCRMVRQVLSHYCSDKPRTL